VVATPLQHFRHFIKIPRGRCDGKWERWELIMMWIVGEAWKSTIVCRAQIKGVIEVALRLLFLSLRFGRRQGAQNNCKSNSARILVPNKGNARKAAD
jgi:hypothetical protein